MIEIARVLDLPLTLLIELAQRVTPFVSRYLAEVPAAGRLFLEIARRQLGPAQLARLHAVMDAELSTSPADGVVTTRSWRSPVPCPSPRLTRSRCSC